MWEDKIRLLSVYLVPPNKVRNEGIQHANQKSYVISSLL